MTCPDLCENQDKKCQKCVELSHFKRIVQVQTTTRQAKFHWSHLGDRISSIVIMDMVNLTTGNWIFIGGK